MGNALYARISTQRVQRWKGMKRDPQEDTSSQEAIYKRYLNNLYLTITYIYIMVKRRKNIVFRANYIDAQKSVILLLPIILLFNYLAE